jgi:hypothetical protein
MVQRAIVLSLAVVSIASMIHGQTPVYFDPQDATIAGSACDDTLFCIEVHIGSAPDIKGYDVAIAMDPYYLEVADVPEGNIFSSWGQL